MKIYKTLSIGFIAVIPIIICWTSRFHDDRELLLTQRPWKLNAKLETKVGDGDWKIVESSSQKCDGDDMISFGAHNTYDISFGEILCPGEKKITRTGTWLITAKEGKLLIDNDALYINILNEDTLQVTRGNRQHQDRYTYIHR